MQLVIKFVGVAIIVLVCVFLLRIDLLRGLLKLFSRGSRLYIIALVRISLAVILFVGATQCRRYGVIIAIGILFLLSGISILILSPATSRKLITWYQNRSDLFLRLLTLIGMVIGVLIIYAS